MVVLLQNFGGHSVPPYGARLGHKKLHIPCAYTPWDFSQDLGNGRIDLGFSEFAMPSWAF